MLLRTALVDSRMLCVVLLSRHVASQQLRFEEMHRGGIKIPHVLAESHDSCFERVASTYSV